MADFVHLHCHSEFSLLDGYARIDALVATARGQGARGLALTDHGVMYGAIDFYQACKKAELKPIVGLEAYVAPNSRFDKRPKIDTSPFHLTLLAKDPAGYKNLIQLTTLAHTEGFYYKPRIDRELLEKHARGLVCLSGCAVAEVPRLVRAGDTAAARRAAEWYRELFGRENYYVEIQHHDMPETDDAIPPLLELAAELGIPVVATNDVHYVTPEDHRGQDILLCIQTNSTYDDPNRMRMGTNTFYLRSPDEMAERFGELPAALASSIAIAEQCDLKLDFSRLHLPDVDVPAGMTVDSYLEQLCRQGLRERLGTVGDEYERRIRYELEVVRQTGFAQYILIVWDIMAYARRRGIIAGPRGSAAGGLILYALGISDVDPVAQKLTFERFLNPERAEMPDVDMDFADDRRDEMINYVTEKYGREHVAQIITFGTLGAKAAIRDTGRALGMPAGEVDRVAKLVPGLPVGITIDRAIGANPLLKQLRDEDETVQKLIEDAKRVEGYARHASTHAAGVVISQRPLTEYTPLQPTSRNDSALMTQYHADNLQKIGLLKMDFLGLSNLTILGRAVEAIRRLRGDEIDLLKIPFDDRTSFELLGRGETVGLFQLEGRGMTGYLRELKPTSIADLTAMIALYRPGPMANIPQYIARKHGSEPITYPHPLLEEILADTYGVLTYQDQVLQVLGKVAGYTLGQADIVRKAMGKKIRELMEKERARFEDGCRKNGISQETCEELWNLLEPFSGYGFNRAHAACYAQIAYQTAYLKANYPAEFMVAVLSTFRDNADRVTTAVVECRRMGIEVLPPEVNRSELDFTVELRDGREAIRYGLAAIKNVGEQAAEPIVAARRAGGPFASIDDFARRVDMRQMNKRVLECLIRAGALDTLGRRGALLKALDKVVGAAQQSQRAAEVGQASIFDLLPAAETTVVLALPDEPEAPERQKLEWEKELLGVYFSEHPMREVSRALVSQVSCFCGEVNDEFVGQRIILAGVVSGLRTLMTRKKEPMCAALLEDAHGSVEVVAFPRVYAQTRGHWREGAMLLIRGKVELREERPQVVVDALEPIDPEAPFAAPSDLPAAEPPAAPTEPAVAVAAANGGLAVEAADAAGAPAETNGRAPAASRERVVVGPQARGAATAPPSRGGKNGYGHGREPEPTNSRPQPSGPPKRLVITLPAGPQGGVDGSLLLGVIDVLESHAGTGNDAVAVRVPSGLGTVELDRPGLTLHYGIQVTHQLRRLLPEDAWRVEEAAWAS
ncbi:MAG TPA: DNA polymerase III subunit alpha [Chloroflexota bacterium]|nr:DNA polymerase III subunit alpha [Chloroflexota bacterium]